MNESSAKSNIYLPYTSVNSILQKYGCKNFYIIILYILSSSTWALTSIVLFLPIFIVKKISCGENDMYWCNPNLNGSISIKDEFNLTNNDSEFFYQSYFIGNIVGSATQSFLADIYGRKCIALPSFVLTSLFGFLMTCFSNYVFIVILRFFQGLFLSTANGIIFVLASENAPIESHPMIALLCNLSWALGLIFIVPVTYYFPNWKPAIIITHVPLFVLPILLWFILPESLHFLFEKKQEDEIKYWIKNANKYSKKNFEIDINKCIEKFHGPDGEFKKGNHSNRGLLKVFNYYYSNKKFIIYLIFVLFISFNGFLSYFVFTTNAIELVGNPYLNFALISLVEFPTSVFAPLSINKFGRRTPMILCFFLIAILELILAIVPENIEKVYLLTFLLNKGLLALNCIYMFVYFSEIFPTEIRNSSVGAFINSSAVGGIIAGILCNSWNRNKFIYLFSFSTLSFINIGFLYYLPNNDKQLK